MNKSIFIKNALVVDENKERIQNIHIKNEKIEELGEKILMPNDALVIDGKGKILIPGGIDIHTHFCLDAGISKASDDFYTGTIAAVCGGTTTIVDHPGFGPDGCSLNHQIEAYHKLARDKAVIDYGFHGVVQHVDDKVLNDINSLTKAGITSFKIYLTYNYKIDDGDALRFMEAAGKLGALTAVHAENHGIIQTLRGRFKEQNLLTPRYHSLSRPAECEAEAISRITLIAHIADDAPLYIVHLSGALGLKFIKEARQRGQKNIFIETCPQYLLLDDSLYDTPDLQGQETEGLKYIMSPPLRKKSDNAALWLALKKDIDSIATDHCPFFFAEQKIKGKDNFMLCPSGAPGVEERMQLLFSEGVIKKKISLRRFVKLCCENPAKIAGLYPQKGVIKVGSDADLVLLNPNIKKTLNAKTLKSNVDYSAYEGFKIEGTPEIVISRGEIIVKNGEFKGKSGRGRFLKRGFCQTV